MVLIYLASAVVSKILDPSGLFFFTVLIPERSSKLCISIYVFRRFFRLNTTFGAFVLKVPLFSAHIA